MFLEQQQFKNLEEHLLAQSTQLLKDFCGVSIACSGGSDSVALLYLIYQFTKKHNTLPLSICHVNFGLRGQEAQQDEYFVAQLAQKFKLPFFLLKVTIPPLPNSTGLQVWARKTRYRFFEKLTTQRWAIALGHTQDDVCENTLMRISKGISPFALAGMSTWHPPYWRPLLNTPKKELERMLIRQYVPFKHDTSNDKIIYTRNYWRHNIITEMTKLNPKSQQHVAYFAQDLATITTFITNTYFKNIKITNHKHKKCIDIYQLYQLPQELISHAISYILGKPATDVCVNKKTIQSIAAAVQKKYTKWQIDIAGYRTLKISQNQLIIEEKQKKKRSIKTQLPLLNSTTRQSSFSTDKNRL